MRTQQASETARAVWICSIACIALPAQAAGTETMLSLYQRHRGMGDIEVEIARKAAKITQKDGSCFIISSPSFDVNVFNSKRKKIATLTYANFMRNGPKHIEYLEGATEWPLVVESNSADFKGMPVKIYALPFKRKDGQLVDLKRGKAGSYYVLTTFKIDEHIVNFLCQMFHIQKADGIPLKYVKLGNPFTYGQGLAYNKTEGVITVLDTITAKTKPLPKGIFTVPQGYKKTTESDVTMGDKTNDIQEIMKELN